MILSICSIMVKSRSKRCANCNGRLVTEYRSGGYDYVQKITCVKCGQYGEKVWLGMGRARKKDLQSDFI